MQKNKNIYIGTILLERNRHKPPKEPSYLVSEWLQRFADDGFDGLEFWENHAKLRTEEELEKLRHSPPCFLTI